MDVAVMRNARFIGLEDFLYLLRKDKVNIFMIGNIEFRSPK